MKVTSCDFTPSPKPSPISGSWFASQNGKHSPERELQGVFVEATQWRMVPAALPSSVSRTKGSNLVLGEAQELCFVPLLYTTSTLHPSRHLEWLKANLTFPLPT